MGRRAAGLFRGLSGPLGREHSMVNFFLDGERVSGFVAHLMDRKPVYAPHAKGKKSFAFELVSDPSAVVLDYRSRYTQADPCSRRPECASRLGSETEFENPLFSKSKERVSTPNLPVSCECRDQLFPGSNSGSFSAIAGAMPPLL